MFIESDPDEHYFNIYPQHADDFRRVVLFDFIINNADRKAGHCLLDAGDRMWSIDHGICFNEEDKLRTVIWEFAGEPIPADMLADIERLRDQFNDSAPPISEVCRLLRPGEVEATRRRIDTLIASGRFPQPDPRRRNHPWPPI